MTKMNKRIVLSAVALGLFAIYILCDNIVLSIYESYYTYSWRQGVIADLIHLLPFIALLAGTIMDKKTYNINPRTFPFMFVVMSLLCYLAGEIVIGRMHFGYLYDTIDEIIGYDTAMYVFMITTLLIAGNMTVFSGRFVRIYAGAHIAVALLSAVLNVLMGIELGAEYIINAIGSVAHLLAYATLFSYGGIFCVKNESRTVTKLVKWAWPSIMGDEEDEIEEKKTSAPWAISARGNSDLEKIKQWALITENRKVLYACAIIEKLGNGELLDEMGDLYEKDFIEEQYVVLYNGVKLLNEEVPELLSKGLEEKMASVIDATEKRYLSSAYNMAHELCENETQFRRILNSYLIQCISNREE